MTDSSGTIIWNAEYKPFGEATVTTNGLTNNLRFPGQYFDAETGLHYNYFRDYNPAVGRYIEADPIGLAGGVNLYAYVKNRPLKYIDILGLWGDDVHSGIGNKESGTYVWALRTGFSENEAKIIAKSNSATDNYANWAFLIGVPGRHFNTAVGNTDSRLVFAARDLELAIKLRDAGQKENSLNILGRGLHSLQDYYAHGDWPFIVRHPEWYDDPVLNAAALSRTEEMTYIYLKKYTCTKSRN